MRTLIIIIAIFSLTNSYGQSADTTALGIELFKEMPYNLNFETNCRGREPIQRQNKNEVTFSFFQDISDSVRIYINDILVFNKYVIHDSNLISTNYTGVDFSNHYRNKINRVKIAYTRAKAYIEFPLDKKFPLYGIYFLQNARFFVSGRKCIMLIK